MNKSRGSGHQRPEPRDARHGKMMGNLLGECLAFWVTRFFALLEWYVFFWEHVSQDVPWRLEQNMEYGGWEEGRFFGATSQSKVDLCRMTRGKLYRTPNWGPKKNIFFCTFPFNLLILGVDFACVAQVWVCAFHTSCRTLELWRVSMHNGHSWPSFFQLMAADTPGWGDAYRSYRHL